ncbi:MAG: hypothetical protein D6796_10345, partial [Caldilineae bacterium]
MGDAPRFALDERRCHHRHPRYAAGGGGSPAVARPHSPRGRRPARGGQTASRVGHLRQRFGVSHVQG